MQAELEETLLLQEEWSAQNIDPMRRKGVLVRQEIPRWLRSQLPLIKSDHDVADDRCGGRASGPDRRDGDGPGSEGPRQPTRTRPGVLLACEFGSASVDHCTYLSAADIDALSSSGTVATLLPGVAFSTRSPYPDARRLIEAGVTVALASDCNPGSCFTTSMPFCIALAVFEMGMTPAEALWSATVAVRRRCAGST